MGISIPAVSSPDDRHHEPEGEVWVGVRIEGTESPLRAEAIRSALARAGAPFVEPTVYPDSSITAVHDQALVDWQATAHDEWVRAGLDRDPGQDRVVPYIFPHPGLLEGIDPIEPSSASARAGRYVYDTMTLIDPGTWKAARAAADVALTAAGLVESGTQATYGLCRPPGHHAARSAIGGSCYLNNSAIAAGSLAGTGRVGVLDIDAHHGNGTQSIFYEDPGVLTCSVHVDPREGWFPHFFGLAGETGRGPGEGTNRNLPLPAGTGDREWLAGVEGLLDWLLAGGAGKLVVALGLDAAAGDPEGPFEVSEAGYRSAGRLIGAAGLPTVFIQEGGYALDTLGDLVIAALEGFEEGAASATGDA